MSPCDSSDLVHVSAFTTRYWVDSFPIVERKANETTNTLPSRNRHKAFWQTDQVPPRHTKACVCMYPVGSTFDTCTREILGTPVQIFYTQRNDSSLDKLRTRIRIQIGQKNQRDGDSCVPCWCFVCASALAYWCELSLSLSLAKALGGLLFALMQMMLAVVLAVQVIEFVARCQGQNSSTDTDSNQYRLVHFYGRHRRHGPGGSDSSSGSPKALEGLAGQHGLDDGTDGGSE